MIIIADTIYDLVENLKKLAVGAQKHDVTSDDISLDFGTVKKLNPFAVDMGKFTIDGDMIVMSGRLRSLRSDGKLHVGDAIVLLGSGGEEWVALDTVDVGD